MNDKTTDYQSEQDAMKAADLPPEYDAITEALVKAAQDDE